MSKDVIAAFSGKVRSVVAGLTTAVAMGTIGSAAHAEATYPSRPITIIVPYTAGGSTDAVARIVAKGLQERLGQPVLVDNRAGGGGNIGTRAVAVADPDGYTLLFATTANAINHTLFKKLEFDFQSDFAPISQLSSSPNVLIVNKDIGVNSVEELIARARAEPGSLSYGASGVGSTVHLAAELFKSMTKTDLTQVTYKGSAAAITDLRSGDIQVMFDNLPSALPQIRANAVKALAVTGREPVAQLDGVPTIDKSGAPGYEAVAWHGLVAPAKTPAEIVARLNKEVAATLGQEDTRRLFENIGVSPASSSPDEFKAHITAEIAKWGEVVKASGAVAD